MQITNQISQTRREHHANHGCEQQSGIHNGCRSQLSQPRKKHHLIYGSEQPSHVHNECNHHSANPEEDHLNHGGKQPSHIHNGCRLPFSQPRKKHHLNHGGKCTSCVHYNEQKNLATFSHSHQFWPEGINPVDDMGVVIRQAVTSAKGHDNHHMKKHTYR